jgi:hypothetical protein
VAERASVVWKCHIVVCGAWCDELIHRHRLTPRGPGVKGENRCRTPQFLGILLQPEPEPEPVTILTLNPPTSLLQTPNSILDDPTCPPLSPQIKVSSFSRLILHTPLTLFIQVSPTITTSSQPSSPQELRHIISAGALTPQRERKLSAHASQHLGLRVGSRSPTSIPSSPTSV